MAFRRFRNKNDILRNRHAIDDAIYIASFAGTIAVSALSLLTLTTDYNGFQIIGHMLSVIPGLESPINAFSLTNAFQSLFSDVWSTIATTFFAGVTGFFFYLSRIDMTQIFTKNPKITKVEPDNYMQEMLSDLAKREGINRPDLYYLDYNPTLTPVELPNAAALGTPQKGINLISRNFDDLFCPSEVEAVLAHEVEHLSRSHTVKGMMQRAFASPTSMIASSFIVIIASIGSTDLSLMGAAWLLFAGALNKVFAGQTSQAFERQADRGAANTTANPIALANALDRLVELTHARILTGNIAPQTSMLGRIWRTIKATHPTTESRIHRLSGAIKTAVEAKYTPEEIAQMEKEYFAEKAEFEARKGVIEASQPKLDELKDVFKNDRSLPHFPMPQSQPRTQPA